MEILNGKYLLEGGIDPLNLVEEYGAPVYVYEADTIKKKYEKMKAAFTVPRFKINYACKALTNISILKYIKSLGAGLDTVSIQEVKLGLKAGFAPKDIIYTPNCVGIQEIIDAKNLGVRINIDNLSILEQFGTLYHNTYPVCVRINPHIMAGGNDKISVGHIDSKFGISIHQLPHVHRIVKATNLNIEGLHFHTGSDILDSEVFLQGAEIMLNAAVGFEKLDYIDFGSGFKVPYKDDGIQTDIEELGEKISTRMNQFIKEYGSKVMLMFEPGKYLVSEAGYFLVKVNVVKQTTSTVFAGVDSGLNHLIRPMFYNAYHKITNISKTEGRERIYTIVGYICETDTFGSERRLHEVTEGDVLAFSNAGAYCYAMASNYNSRYRPAEVLLINGQHHLIRQRETFDDLMKNQIEIDFNKK
jgi:diaminopimelate decarboxylase